MPPRLLRGPTVPRRRPRDARGDGQMGDKDQGGVKRKGEEATYTAPRYS